MKTVNFSHDFFDIWSEKMAYVLGFWYADGCILINKYTRRGKNFAYKRFIITNTDKQIMDEIMATLGIITFEHSNGPNNKNIYDLQVNSDKFFDFCHNLTGTTDKTHAGKWPEIPKDFLHHFIRGFFDGDGSIFIKRYKSRHGGNIENLSSSFTASRNSVVFMERLKDTLISNAGVGNKKLSIYIANAKSKEGKSTGSCKLLFNQHDTGLLCDWMYKDATIFMKRKKKIWDDFDKTKLADSHRFFSNKV